MEHELIPYTATAQVAGNNILVLAPHADDEVFGCGGAIRLHILQGCLVHVVVMTDGAKYGDVIERESESRAAAIVLGYDSLEFWRIPDRDLKFSSALVKKVLTLIKNLRVDLVYAPSPWEVHPDHRQACQIAITAVELATQAVRLGFYEIGAPLRPNMLLDITSVLDAKKDAMSCFVSQMKQQDYRKHILALNAYRTYTLGPEVIAAEGILILTQSEMQTINPSGLCEIVTMGVVDQQATDFRLKTLVSVIVLSENRRHLSAALDSIATQTYPNLEVIVAAVGHQPVDLPARCGRFLMQGLIGDVELDLGAAIRASSGSFFLIVNEDDWMLPGHISGLVRSLAANCTVLAAHSGIQFVDAEGIPTGDTLDAPLTAEDIAAGMALPLGSMLVARGLLSGQLPFNAAHAPILAQIIAQWVIARSCVIHVPGSTFVHRSKNTDILSHLLERRVALPKVDFCDTVTLLKEQNQALTMAYREAEFCCKENKRQIEAIKTSKSWRLTAPLRRMSTLIRRWFEV